MPDKIIVRVLQSKQNNGNFNVSQVHQGLAMSSSVLCGWEQLQWKSKKEEASKILKHADMTFRTSQCQANE